jgi:chromate transporter
MREILVYFLRLGAIGFGGPLSLVAMMQKDLVAGKKWMTEEEFRQVFGLIKAMPGPVAFQTAVFLGHYRRGFWGGFWAAVGLVLPAFLLMIALATSYDRFQENAWIKAVMQGMQIGAFALILWALKSLAEGFSKKLLFWLLFASGLGLTLLTSVPEPLLILLSGSVAVLASHRRFTLQSVELTLAWVGLKAGAFVFGTGLAIVPFLESDFVHRLGWITRDQFMDALAFGQLTPGPVVITISFIGYKVAGLAGALISTGAIFLPSFFHMVTWFPRAVKWMSSRTWIGAFTLGVTAAVCSAIALALFRLAEGWRTNHILILLILLILMNRFKVPTWVVILLSGGIGLLTTSG